MPSNIFQDSTKSVPRQDSQIVRVSMKENEIGSKGVPTPSQSGVMSVQHVPNAGGKN